MSPSQYINLMEYMVHLQLWMTLESRFQKYRPAITVKKKKKRSLKLFESLDSVIYKRILYKTSLMFKGG